MAKNTIEISGLDYTGKSTQAEMLAMETWHQHVKNLGSLAGYACHALPNNLSEQDLFRWWFEESTLPELGHALTAAYVERQRLAEASKGIDVAVVERGSTMLRAQIAANFATRQCTEPSAFYEQADDIVGADTAELDGGAERTELMLTRDPLWLARNIGYVQYARQPKKSGNGFSESQNAFYATYLRNMERALIDLGVQRGIPTVAVDRSAVDVQNVIRRHPALEAASLPTILGHDPIVVGLAGLSESGKSAVAADLAAFYGFNRIKLGYFNEKVRGIGERYGSPQRVALEALHFLATNRHMQRITFESLHGPELSAAMKLLLGDRWRSVYLELDEETRIDRLRGQNPDADNATIATLLEDQRRKDATKITAGIEAYKRIADVVIVNSGTIEDASAAIMKGIL